MKLLLVSATMPELVPLVNFFVPAAHSENSKLKHYYFKGAQIDVLITGAGIAATSFQLGKIFSTSRYDLAINAGIAGSFDHKLKIGAVVNITSDCFADFGAEDGNKFLSAFEIGLLKKDDFPYLNGGLFVRNNDSFLVLDHEIKPKEILSDIPEVTSITVNMVHGNEESIKEIQSRLTPQTESMEGAAFMYACLSENISCLQIRSISNYVQKRNKDLWNIPLAIENLNKKLIALIDKLII